MTWLCLAITSSRHKKIIEKLHAIDVETYYPQRVVWRKRRSGPRVRKSYPLIPSYLFVAFDDKDELHRAILSIDGIINFLGINGKPSMVRPEELIQLRSCEEQGDYDETLSRIDQMLVGLSLPIKDGPFETLYATVRSVTDGEAMVDIELFGRATPLKISVDSLVKPI